MAKFRLMKALVLFIICMSVILAGCNTAQPTSTPDFSIISSPQVPLVAQATPTQPPTSTPLPSPTPQPETQSDEPTVFQMSPVTPAPPTDTPLPPTETPTPVVPTPQPEVTPTTVPTNTSTPRPVAPPDEPRRGGSWDMEDGFEVWINPHGDNCSGSRVAVGWRGFTSRGQYGSSCFYQYDFAPNVFSGQFSQEITFDFVDSHAGLLRVIDSQPGHTYQVTARLKHVHTLPPMQYHFGSDLSGGTDWQAESVRWAPWDEFREGDWITHEETLEATGPATTIYIKGFHETAAQGGATYVDAIEVIDLGER